MDSEQVNSWQKEFDDYLRAFSGAFLFGVPLLFTLEMWRIGDRITDWRLLLFLILGVLANLPLAYFAGFKGESTFRTSLDQAVEAVAVGAVAAAAVLIVLNRIQIGDSLNSILGKIVIQTVPLSLGASVANALLRRSEPGRNGGGSNPEYWRAILNDLGATMAGGVFIGFSIAPTEEVLLLALEMNNWHRLALIGLSLLVTYIIVFESGFSPQRKEVEQSFLERPITETVVGYVVSLGVAGAALLMFGQIGFGDPLLSIMAQVLVLGFPTAVGGAAGRLVI